MCQVGVMYFEQCIVMTKDRTLKLGPSEYDMHFGDIPQYEYLMLSVMSV